MRSITGDVVSNMIRTLSNGQIVRMNSSDLWCRRCCERTEFMLALATSSAQLSTLARTLSPHCVIEKSAERGNYSDFRFF